MAAYQGPFATTNTTGQTTDATAGQRPESWRETFLRLYPTTQKNAPLAALTAKMKSKEMADDPVFHWFEKDIPVFFIYINNGAGYAAGATALEVDDGAGGTTSALRLRAGHQIRNERTGECMWVTSDPTTGKGLTVDRSMGATAAAAINDDDVLTVLGTVHGENSDVPTSINHTGLPFSNVLQIFREPFSMSGTAKGTKLRTGDGYKEKRLDALEQYNMQLEMAFWFSQQQQTSGQIIGGTGLPERSTGGLFEYMITNAVNATTNFGSGNGLPGDTTASTVNIGEFENALEQFFRYGSGEKAAFCGSGALLTLQKLQRLNASIQIVPGNDKFGLGMTKWLTPFGTLNLLNHPLFSVHPIHRYTMAMVDLPKLRYRYMKGRDTGLLKDRQGNGVDGTTDEFLGEVGLEVQHEKTHGYILNMINAA